MQPNNDQNTNPDVNAQPGIQPNVEPQPFPQPAPSQPVVGAPAPTQFAAPASQPPSQPAPTSFGAPITGGNANSSKSPMKMILLIVGALVVIGLAAATYFLVFAKDDEKSSSTTSNAKTEQAASNNAVSSESTQSPASPASAKDTINTLCYSFNVPVPHETLPTENACDTPIIFYGSTSSAGIDVMPAANGAKSLAEMVTRWKKDYATYTIVKEEKTKVAGLDAQRILHRSGPESNGGSASVAYIVYTAPKPYAVQGVKVEGFTISGGYDAKNADSIKGMDSIIASWAWK